MTRKKLITAGVCFAVMPVMVMTLTGCSRWYCDTPAYTRAKEGSLIDAPAYDSVVGYEKPDTSEIQADIEKRTEQVEKHAEKTKEDCSKNAGKVSKAASNTEESIGGESRNFEFEDYFVCAY